MLFSKPVSYHQATKLLPRAFNQDRMYESATPKQLAFLSDAGFTDESLWTKEAAMFALDAFKYLRNVLVYDMNRKPSDRKLRKLVHKAFRNGSIVMTLYSLHLDTARSGERHSVIVDWLERNY